MYKENITKEEKKETITSIMALTSQVVMKVIDEEDIYFHCPFIEIISALVEIKTRILMIKKAETNERSRRSKDRKKAQSRTKARKAPPRSTSKTADLN